MAQPGLLPGPLPSPRASGSCTEPPGFLMALAALLLLSIHMGPSLGRQHLSSPGVNGSQLHLPFQNDSPHPQSGHTPRPWALSCAPPQGLDCLALKRIPRAQRMMGAERMLSKYVLSESMNELAQ